MDILLNYDYPGNIRELENIIEHACVLCRGEVVERRHLPVYLQQSHSRAGSEALPREDIPSARDLRERELLLEALEAQGWHRQKTAQALGIDRTTLWRKMKKHNISP